ncbi:hypothetical protein EK21DRAFT_16390, partial [Setomelanomma holmii]
RSYTVDEVKEAYTVLVDPKQKAEYDNWLLRNPGVVRSEARQHGVDEPSSDFVLGLDVLDLNKIMDNNEEVEGQMEWTRSCRCGAEKGFKILEEELEDAEKRGEKEVLVGCEGCSLWVRVGFEV